MALIESSVSCSQKLQYDCYKNMMWQNYAWVGRDNTTQYTYFDTGTQACNCLNGRRCTYCKFLSYILCISELYYCTMSEHCYYLHGLLFYGRNSNVNWVWELGTFHSWKWSLLTSKIMVQAVICWVTAEKKKKHQFRKEMNCKNVPTHSRIVWNVHYTL